MRKKQKTNIQPPENKSVKRKKSSYHAYVKYTTIAFSLAGAAFIGYLIGNALDEWSENERPYWTAGFIAFFTISYLVKIIIDLTKKK